MGIVKNKIDEILKDKGLTRYKVSKVLRCSESAFNQMARGEIAFTEKVKEKILPILEIKPAELEGWILADKYPENILKRALEVKQEIKPEAGKLTLTIKTDSLLQGKGLSRTALSGLIGYSQGKLNQMIKGDEPISPLVISKIAPVLEVSEDEIISWVVADKWSIEAFRVALSV